MPTEEIFKRVIELPLDLVEEILLRLPVKTLHRFRCISKPLYSLISHPSFHKQHYRRQSLQNSLLLLVENEDDINGDIFHLHLSTYNNEGDLLSHFSLAQTIPINNKSFTPIFSLIQSCFGLVCLRDYRSPILVFNPCTEQLVTVPLPSPSEDQAYCIGFGYTAFTKEFKVVAFFQRKIDNVEICEIFTLCTTSGWREAKSPPPFETRLGAPLVHGALHLMPSEDIAPDDQYIAAFNIDTEEYRQIPLPETYFCEARTLGADIKEFTGSLCLIFDFSATEKYMLELWFLKDYNCDKWVKEYNIDLTMFQVFPEVIMGDGSILSGVSNQRDYQLRCYNTQEKSFGHNFLKKKINRQSSATLYVESFMYPGCKRPPYIVDTSNYY